MTEKNKKKVTYDTLNNVILAEIDDVVIKGTEKSDVYVVNPDFFIQDRSAVEIIDPQGAPNAVRINKLGMPDLQVDLVLSPVDAGEFGTYTLMMHHNNVTKQITFEGGQIDQIVGYGWCATGPGEKMFVWKHNPKLGRPDYYNQNTGTFVSEGAGFMSNNLSILPVYRLELGTNGDDRIHVTQHLDVGRQYEITGGEGNDTFVFNQEEMRLNNVFVVDDQGHNRIIVDQPMTLVPLAPISIIRHHEFEGKFMLRFGSSTVMFEGGHITDIGKAVNGSEMKTPIFVWKDKGQGQFDYFDNRLRMFVGDLNYENRFIERLGVPAYPESVTSLTTAATGTKNNMLSEL